MEKKSFEKMPCPVARSLEHVGEWWNILILRDAMMGLKRFDEFQTSLDIAPNTLSRRLESLVESGLLVRSQYNERPPRYEYILTDRGKDFFPVVVALLAWGNKHYSAKGIDTIVVNRKSESITDPVMVDRKTGQELSYKENIFAAGPASNKMMRKYYHDLGLPVIESESSPSPTPNS